MLDMLKSELLSCGIELVGALPLSKCKLLRPYKLKNAGFDTLEGLSVIVMAIPYYTEQKARNVSMYAVSRDYHLFAKELFRGVLPRLAERFPQYRFSGYADNSPISEVYAAALSGIGMIGDNMMLITEKYSSYVFLGEIITDLPIASTEVDGIRTCEHCGRCQAACPMSEIGECLSALTQKKGTLSDSEAQYIQKYGSAWGCDICQEVCPHTARAIRNKTIYTNIDFFKADTLPYLTSERLLDMTDAQFAERAFSWRGRNTIMRNLKILESNGKGGQK